MTEIISSRMFAALPAFYPDTCTIQQATDTRDAAGQPISAWADYLTGISCRVAPAGGSERKQPDAVYSIATHTIALAGNYPTITPKMRAVVSGQVYDILLPESDGQGASTRLTCQVVT